MVDHRRTPSQRAYQLPGGFFILTGVLGVLALATAGWVFVANPFGPPAKSAPPSVSGPTATSSAEPTPTKSPEPAPKPSGRDGIDVLVLNATTKAGLAADVAKTAEEAGWTVGDVGNWPYPAAQNAVFYPEGHEVEAELLGEDLSITSVRPARPGMSADRLTVILLTAP